jgi:hypothetical protein
VAQIVAVRRPDALVGIAEEQRAAMLEPMAPVWMCSRRYPCWSATLSWSQNGTSGGWVRYGKCVTVNQEVHE